MTLLQKKIELMKIKQIDNSIQFLQKGKKGNHRKVTSYIE